VAGVALRALGWLWWRAWTPLIAGDAAALCAAGAALGVIYLRLHEMWHLVTSTFVSYGRHGTWGGHWAGSGGAHGLDWSPVTLRHFAWQAWYFVISTFVLCGRRGTW